MNESSATVSSRIDVCHYTLTVWLKKNSLACDEANINRLICPYQFMDRLLLVLMPAKHQPDLIYLRHVPQRRIHLFTFIQGLCLALLWILKSTVAAIVFPVMVKKPKTSRT